MLGVIDSVETRRFSVEEYHLMAEAGILGPDERIELIRGVVHTMSPKGRAHTVAGARVGRILNRKLEGRASVYPEASLPFPELSSEPQPDVVVCSSPDIDAFGTEASKPLLVVEVSHSSKRLDLGPKALLYAEGRYSGILGRRSRRPGFGRLSRSPEWALRVAIEFSAGRSRDADGVARHYYRGARALTAVTQGTGRWSATGATWSRRSTGLECRTGRSGQSTSR